MNDIRQQIRSMLRVEPRAAGFRATLHIDPAFRLFPDHFAARPILPGMCLVQAVLLAAAAHLGHDDLQLRVLKNAKFFAPAQPGDQVLIDGDAIPDADGVIQIKANLTLAGKRLAQITLTAQIPHPAEATP